MRAHIAPALALVLVSAPPAGAHRLDEYLQATTIAVEQGRVEVQVSLVPGVAVFPALLAEIDSNGDGVISRAEQQAYGERVVRDLALSVDCKRLPLRLAASTFAPMEVLREGRGEIRLELEAEVPLGDANRKLTFENHHQSHIGVYLVNALVPSDPAIRIVAQNRNFQQSFYQLDYSVAPTRATRPRPAPRRLSASPCS